MSYIKDNFLLTNKTAEKLYFGYAKDMPIFDYHCHLPEKQILENKPFHDVFEIWLAGDHYKWRLMRSFMESANGTECSYPAFAISSILWKSRRLTPLIFILINTPLSSGRL